MKIRSLLSLLCIFFMLSACGPYRGFTGVNPKGMSSTGALPSQKLKKSKKRLEKKQKRMYKREMKKKAKRMGTTKKR